MREQIIQRLIVAEQLMGVKLTEDAITALAAILEQHGEGAIAAIDAVMRKEDRLNLRTVEKYLPGRHPDADVAWAHVPKDESGCAYVTTAMMHAYGAAEPLIEAGDMIAARMAFKASYNDFTSHNEPDWFFTGGYGAGIETQRALKKTAIDTARRNGWLTNEKADQFMKRLPTGNGLSDTAKESLRIAEASKSIPQPERAEKIRESIEAMKAKVLTRKS